MAWRYCRSCGNPQDRISFEDLAGASFTDDPITCEHCDAEREDDTPNARIAALVEEIIALKAKSP